MLSGATCRALPLNPSKDDIAPFENPGFTIRQDTKKLEIPDALSPLNENGNRVVTDVRFRLDDENGDNITRNLRGETPYETDRPLLRYAGEGVCS